MSKRHIFNAKPYAIDSPVVLSPGESASVDDSPEIDVAIGAGVLGENAGAAPKHQTTKASKAEDK